MRKFMTFAACAVLTAGMNGAVMADDGASLYTSKLCNTCHGADGKTPVMPTYPKIAGQNEEYLIQQIKDIKDGNRTNGMAAAMKPMVATVNEGEIKKIAKWLASQ
uniref:Cytochrome c n=1 Tax=Candidatus Kentrum sp. LPFa TaxID=2126335 RepID=A0A450WS94_9GAMM|nr:MAG: cytochrome c [Candidatus Kentron sp. LPFa]